MIGGGPTPAARRATHLGSLSRRVGDPLFQRFPHGTVPLPLNPPYLALEDGPPLFGQGLSRLTGVGRCKRGTGPVPSSVEAVGPHFPLPPRPGWSSVTRRYR